MIKLLLLLSQYYICSYGAGVLRVKITGHELAGRERSLQAQSSKCRRNTVNTRLRESILHNRLRCRRTISHALITDTHFQEIKHSICEIPAILYANCQSQYKHSLTFFVIRIAFRIVLVPRKPQAETPCRGYLTHAHIFSQSP